MGKHIQTQTEWEEDMAVQVLSYARDSLYMELRFLGIALSALEPAADGQLLTLATDGTYLKYSSEQLLRLFRDNDRYLNRLYLHTVLHCLFRQLWIGGDRETRIWNTACDIAVEYVIDSIDKPCVKRIVGWVRQSTYDELSKNGQGISAAVVYNWLLDKKPEELDALHREFFADDHRYWPKEEKNRAVPQQARARWDKLARQTQLDQNRRGDETNEGQEFLQSQIKAGGRRRSYREFLQKFAVYREELKIDEDEFDLNYYTYGLKLYGNMPLLEPLESRESKRIQDFVIVVDTSYSTSGELVQSFLQETFDILAERNNFFHFARIRVLQCDEQVQRDDLIERQEQLEELFRDFVISGGGGTDFRPAFSYVDNLLAAGEFDNLCGLLYFTDGKGIYPRKKPSYPVAFLFLEDYEEEKVPGWAMRHRFTGHQKTITEGLVDYEY